MLTVDFDRWGVRRGETLLDLGCGSGRHSFEAARRGVHVVGVDHARPVLGDAGAMLAAMNTAGEVPADTLTAVANANALALPFRDSSFDCVIASEILEHIPDDLAAISEIGRVLKPQGRAVVTVPRWWPERICWAISSEYHSTDGGHVRIYRYEELLARLRSAGLVPVDKHHGHALHSPFWWIKCAVGVSNDEALLPRLYHRFLVWDITRRPRATRFLERLLNPILGKSVVIYLIKEIADEEVRHAA